MHAAVVVRRVLGHGGKNWVTETPAPDSTLGGAGALPKYISFIAGRLHEQGHSTSEAIALAVAAVKRWAAGGDNVSPVVRARAAAALAEWEAKRALAKGKRAANLSNPVDLAGPYQWRHGWIPLTPAALAIKLHKAHGHAGSIGDAHRFLRSSRTYRQGMRSGIRTPAGQGTHLQRAARARAGADALEGQTLDDLHRGDKEAALAHAGQAAGMRRVALHEGRLKAGTLNRIDQLIPPSAYDPTLPDAELFKAVQAHLRGPEIATFSNGGTVQTDIAEGVHVYDPKGDELAEVSRTVKGIDALKRRGNTKQASALEAALVRGKTSRARKMPDGTVRAHTATEVQAGIRRLRGGGTTNLAGGAMQTVDLAGYEPQPYHADPDETVVCPKCHKRNDNDARYCDQCGFHLEGAPGVVVAKAGASLSNVNLAGGTFLAKMFPDATSVKKAAAKLGKLPPPLRKNLAAQLAKRAGQLGIKLTLANQARLALDLSVDQDTRDAARKAGLTFPGTTSYPLAGSDGKFTKAMAQKAVRMVGLGNVASNARIRTWLVGKLKANGCSTLIPSTWPEAKG